MKNFRLITSIIFCMLSIKVNAQVIVWEKAVDSVSTNNYYGQFSNQVVAKRINSDNILLLQQFIVDSTSFAYNQVRYDSLKIDKFTINGQRKWTKKYPLSNGGVVKDFIETADKHILLLIDLGINNSVVKLDSNGNIVNIKNFLNTDSLLRLTKIVDAKDGNFLILSKRSIYEFDDQNCWWWWWYSFTKGYNTKTYLTKINSNLNMLWNKQLTDNYIHTFDLGYSYQMVELFPTTIDVLDDNNHSINIIHQVKEGYDLVNQLKLERYSTNGDKEFEKVLLDSITTAEACSYGLNFSILRWKDNYISEASKTANNLSYIEKMKFNLDGDTIEQTSLSSNNYNFPFSILPYAYNKSFTKAGDDVYIVGASYFNFANSTNGYLVFKGNNDLNVLWSENIAKPSQNIYDVILNTEFDDTSILCISLVNDTSVADSMFQVQFVKISLTGNQLYYSSYVDRNFNGTKDADDTLFADGLIEVSNGNTSVDYTPNYDGTFSKIVGKGTFVSKLIDYNQRLKYYTVNPINKTTIFNGTKQVDSIFFRLTPKPNIQDLQVSIVPITIARPGFNSSYKIIAKNVGTKMMFLPIVKFIKDSLQTFTDSTTYVLDNDTLLWQIDSLSLLEQREIIVSVLNAIPPTLNANDTLHLSAQIFPMENDSFVQDNYASLNQVVVNSVDPNDKIETHGGTIPYSAVQNREYLYYTIRFQNTGNSYASRIVITDTLTENVDASTLEFLSSSVPFVMNVVDRKHITWTAANTYLPDSIADEANSHGYISFRIKPSAGLLPSDEITNRASIVFDYNAAILTNTCTTNIIEQRILSVKNNEIKSIHLFPNPTNGNVQLNMNLLQNKNYTLRIIDINGNLLSNENLKGNAGENNVSIDLSNYANGLYFIQLADETGNLFYGKVVKQ